MRAPDLWFIIHAIVNNELISASGKAYTIRRYDRPAIFQRPIDRVILHLAYHCVDDYCNPPELAWAALIHSPGESLKVCKLLSGARMTDDEVRFIFDSRFVIIAVSPSHRVRVDYFFDDMSARAAWHAIKHKAQS